MVQAAWPTTLGVQALLLDEPTRVDPFQAGVMGNLMKSWCVVPCGSASACPLTLHWSKAEYLIVRCFVLNMGALLYLLGHRMS